MTDSIPDAALRFELVEAFEAAVRDAEHASHFGTVRGRRESCAEQDQSRAKLLALIESLAAQAIEARRAETTQIGSVEDERAVGNADVPKPSPENTRPPSNVAGAREIEERARELLAAACGYCGVEPPPGHMLLAPFTEASAPWIVAIRAIEAALRSHGGEIAEWDARQIAVFACSFMPLDGPEELRQRVENQITDRIVRATLSSPCPIMGEGDG